MRKVSKLSQKLSQIRRVHFIGETDNSCRMIIPRQIVKRIGIGPHEYLRISLDEETNKITVEKLSNEIEGGIIDNK
jgi:antitoxin component of MazEF toxin-antitoxin module